MIYGKVIGFMTNIKASLNCENHEHRSGNIGYLIFLLQLQPDARNKDADGCRCTPLGKCHVLAEVPVKVEAQ